MSGISLVTDRSLLPACPQGYDTAGGYGATQGTGYGTQGTGYGTTAAGYGSSAGYGQLSQGYGSGMAGAGQKRDASYTLGQARTTTTSAVGRVMRICCVGLSLLWWAQCWL